MLKTNNIKSHP